MRVSDEDIGRAARKLDLLSELTDEEVSESLNTIRPDLYELALDEAEYHAGRRWRYLLIAFLICLVAGVAIAVCLYHKSFGF